MGLKVGIVVIEKYNPLWKKEFNKEKKVLEEIFRNAALTIEHIGSTSIPGLSAKPIIDIAIGIKSLSDFNLIKERIMNISDYSIKEDSVQDEILIRKGSEDNRTHFIHVMELNSNRYKDTILFRDYLINNPEVLKKYEKLKQKLAIKYPNDRKMYTSSKNEFITNILNIIKGE